jgi:hypothetical protein
MLFGLSPHDVKKKVAHILDSSITGLCVWNKVKEHRHELDKCANPVFGFILKAGYKALICNMINSAIRWLGWLNYPRRVGSVEILVQESMTSSITADRCSGSGMTP